MVRKEKWSDDAIELAHPTVDKEHREVDTYGEHYTRIPMPPIRNPVIDAICNRRSVRIFKPDPIPDDVLWTVLEAGRWAPTGEDLQPWYTLVIKDPVKRKKMYEFAMVSARRRGVRTAGAPIDLSLFLDRFTHLNEKRLTRLRETMAKAQWKEEPMPFTGDAWKAPVQLLVLSQMFNGWDMVWDTTCAIENMLIAAVSLGLGAVWIATPISDIRHGKKDAVGLIYKMLKIPWDYRCVAWICMGYPAQHPKPRPRFFTQDKVFFDEWGNWQEMPTPKVPRRYMELPEYARY